jgi:hypothetical protein
MAASACVTQPSGPATWVPGTCEGTEGVTVVVDFSAELNDRQMVRCALGTQASGIAALEAIGLAINVNAPDAPDGTVCTIDTLPIEGYPYCWLTDGYWSYWRAANTAGTWDYAPSGPSEGPLVPGTVEGFAWAQDFMSDGPRTGPDGLPLP